jgi:hypothetical protein
MNHADNNDLNNIIKCIKRKIAEDNHIKNNRPPNGFTANFLNKIAEIYETYGFELAETELQRWSARNRQEAVAILKLLTIFNECGLTDQRIGGMLIKTLETTISQTEG